MDLNVNQAIRITNDIYSGIYRVVAANPVEVFLAIILADHPHHKKPGPRLKGSGQYSLRSRSLLTLKKKKIQEMIEAHHVMEIETLLSNDVLRSIDLDSCASNAYRAPKKSIQERYENNLKIMGGFLDPNNLRSSILRDRSFTGLIKDAIRENKVDPKKVYRLLRELIDYGFSPSSLIPRYSNSGGRGKSRPFKEGSKKPGVKTKSHRLALLNGVEPPKERPGMSQEWRDKCRSGVDSFIGPQPSATALYIYVLCQQFTAVVDVKGMQLSTVKLKSHPSKAQFLWWYKTDYTLLERVRRRTTHHNYIQNHRGLLGKSSDGLSGPGHTYAIDSTLGDIYLVSRLNRNIVVGRPVHYFLVDVWSGAIVGFYVCLHGPSWEAAKIALFCAVYNPKKLAQLRGHVFHKVLDPAPGLPVVILGDRAEYLGLEAQKTFRIFRVDQQFTPPYRGDGKGITEVQFLIIKDGQVAFIPGTHDARRIEMEKRKSKPLDATMDLHEYCLYLTNHVRSYNLTTDMSHRLDDYMLPRGIDATPAGLWKWGHSSGIGFAERKPEAELIRTLLPQVEISSTSKGLSLGGRFYANPTDLDRRLAAEAREQGISSNKAWFYPGNMQTIWTPLGCEKGLREVERSSTDSSFVSAEELEDADAMAGANKSSKVDDRTEIKVQSFHDSLKIIATGKQATKKAKQFAAPQKQDVSKNRKDEHAHMMHQSSAAQPQHPSSAESAGRLDGTGDQESWLDDHLLGTDND